MFDKHECPECHVMREPANVPRITVTTGTTERTDVLYDCETCNLTFSITVVKETKPLRRRIHLGEKIIEKPVEEKHEH